MLQGTILHGTALRGSIHPAFLRTAELFAGQIPRSGKGGGALCIYHRGEKVVDCWGGNRDGSGHPWKEDTLSLSYSTSKGVVSTLLHILADRGLVDYDAPVADYWPEFAAGGKAAITVRQLLCHEAGLYDVRSLVDDAARMLDWEYMTEALAEAIPRHEPGREHGYHGFTYGWLVGELIRRVSGKPFGEVLEAELVRPLGLDGCYIGLPEDQRKRRARLLLGAFQQNGDSMRALERNVRPLARLLSVSLLPIDLASLASALLPRGIEQLDFNSPEFVGAAIPAANGCFTARSLARIYAMLANDGELDGVRLLRRETVWHASEVQNRGIGRVIPVPMHWRLGYHRVPTLSARGLPNAFGHFGFGGSGAWADPDRELAVAMTVNSGIGTPFGDLRMVRISTAAVRCADRRAA